MTRRIPIVPTVLVLAAVALLVWLGTWQLQRAKWKEGVLARAAAAETLPPIAWPTIPTKDDELPLFRHATGMCLKPLGRRAAVGENAGGEGGYVIVMTCSTGAEGPGMAVQVGWTKNPNVKVDWAGGPVSGVIVPDSRSRIRLVAATPAAGLEPSRVPDVSSVSPISPGTHRGYAATWFGLAAMALIIYVLALWKRTARKDQVR